MDQKLEKALVGSGVSCLLVGGLAGIISAATETDELNRVSTSVAVCTAVGYTLNRKSGFEYALLGVISATVAYKIGYGVSRFAYEMLK